MTAAGATASSLAGVAARLRDEGGLLAAALLPEPVVAADDPGLGAVAAAGPLASAHPTEIAFVVEAAREGHLLHGGTSRILDTSDLDLALLAGDRLYALALDTLARLGDTAAVRALADAIALSARARAEERPELAELAWASAATAIGWGEAAHVQDAAAAAPAS